LQTTVCSIPGSGSYDHSDVYICCDFNLFSTFFLVWPLFVSRYQFEIKFSLSENWTQGCTQYIDADYYMSFLLSSTGYHFLHKTEYM